MKYTLISVDPVKKHVTFQLEDGIKQTVGDFPVDDAEALKQALANYAASYVSPVKEKVVLSADVKDMLKKEMQVVNVVVDGTVEPKAFDASLSMEEVKDAVVADTTADVMEAAVTDTGIEITTVSANASPAE